jgi:hypothetical protein
MGVILGRSVDTTPITSAVLLILLISTLDDRPSTFDATRVNRKKNIAAEKHIAIGTSVYICCCAVLSR